MIAGLPLSTSRSTLDDSHGRRASQDGRGREKGGQVPSAPSSTAPAKPHPSCLLPRLLVRIEKRFRRQGGVLRPGGRNQARRGVIAGGRILVSGCANTRLLASFSHVYSWVRELACLKHAKACRRIGQHADGLSQGVQCGAASAGPAYTHAQWTCSLGLGHEVQCAYLLVSVWGS